MLSIWGYRLSIVKTNNKAVTSNYHQAVMKFARNRVLFGCPDEGSQAKRPRAE